MHYSRDPRGVQPAHTIVIFIMQSQANRSMAAVMMPSNCTKWQEAFRAHYQKEVIAGGLHCPVAL